MTETQITLKHQMPIIWHLMCFFGGLGCWTGTFTHHPVVAILGLSLTIPALLWYAISKRRLRQLARRIEGR